jgi:predicted transcriptional regulator YdeE
LYDTFHQTPILKEKSVEPRLVERKEMRVMGLKTRTNSQAESHPKTGKIRGLWDRFYDENLKAQILNRMDPDVLLAVYSNYENDFLGNYDTLIGAQVSGFENIPPGLSSEILLPSKYLVFKAKGQMPKAVIETWKEIWVYFSNPKLPHRRAYTADFEWYHSARSNEVDIFVAIK